MRTAPDPIDACRQQLQALMCELDNLGAYTRGSSHHSAALQNCNEAVSKLTAQIEEVLAPAWELVVASGRTTE